MKIIKNKSIIILIITLILISSTIVYLNTYYKASTIIEDYLISNETVKVTKEKKWIII